MAAERTSRNCDVAQVDVHGIHLACLTEAETVAHICRRASASVGGWVVTVNADIARRLSRDIGFAELCHEAMMVADGMPLVWASRLQGHSLPERVAGSTMVRTLSADLAREGLSLYLLGGAPGMADATAGILTQWFPELRIAGVLCPAYGFDKDERKVDAVIHRVRETAPDVVYVALGSPKQERLIARLRVVLPQTWFIGVGISFSFLAGDVKRAPRWMQKTGLEWVHRLVQEPGRLARRYLIDDLPFVIGMLAGSAFRGIKVRMGFSRPASADFESPPTSTRSEQSR